MRRVIWLALVFAAASGACTGRADFERMRQQQRADPFGPAMRVPPSGAVRYGQREGAAADDSEAVAKGERVFLSVCAVCHGADASGRSVVAANIPGNPPPPLNGGHVTAMTDADVFFVISHGRNRMPAFDWSLPASDRWAVIAYLRRLPLVPHAESSQ